MAQLEYGKLGRYLKTGHLSKINIEDFLPQYIVRELNKVLNIGEDCFDSIKMEIPNMHVEFEGYLDSATNEPLSSRLAFYCDDGYAVLNYSGEKEATYFTIYRNNNFFEPATDAVTIFNDRAERRCGDKIVIKEQERGK